METVYMLIAISIIILFWLSTALTIYCVPYFRQYFQWVAKHGTDSAFRFNKNAGWFAKVDFDIEAVAFLWPYGLPYEGLAYLCRKGNPHPEKLIKKGLRKLAQRKYLQSQGVGPEEAKELANDTDVQSYVELSRNNEPGWNDTSQTQLAQYTQELYREIAKGVVTNCPKDKK